MTDTVYLEVYRSNRAIMSYFLELPTAQSSKFDYIPATTAELAYLNALEEAVFPPGTVTTLDDLQAHRARVQALRSVQPTEPFKAAPAAPQQPSKATQGAKKTDSSQSVAKFKNGFKPVQTPTKGN